MDLVFRKISPAEPATAQPGDIYLMPAMVDQRGRRDLAKFVIEHGPDGLLRGPGTPERLIIDADPKLDDMLAATFVQRRLVGGSLPSGCEPFARYAAQLREGTRPTLFPLENSLEGIFLAIRGNAEKPLTDAETAKQFTADWARMATVILQAAERKDDPFTRPLFGFDAAGERTYSLQSINRGGPAPRAEAEFAREFAFLSRDLEAYRQDFARGERWQVRLPGLDAPIPGLFLRQPKSLLFKYWTRSPCPPPLDGPYHFLAVTWGNGQWIFSTSSAQKSSLQPLAELLQAAERKQGPNRADQDPWFDGKPQFTLVSSPRSGTRLADATVLRIARKWSRTRIIGRRWTLGRVAAALAVILAVTAALFIFLGQRNSHELAEIHDLYVLSVGVSEYPNLGDRARLPNAVKDAAALETAFKKLEGRLCNKVFTRVLQNDEATRANIIGYGLKSWLMEQQALTRHSLVIVTFSGHGFVEADTNRYLFAPHDYDAKNQGTTGVFLEDLQRYLVKLPCPVVLMFDTCHSGAIDDNEDDDAGDAAKVLKNIQKSVNDSKSNQGMAVMVACARYQKANDTDRWGHGALTLALLEGIGGKYIYPAKDRYRTPLPRPGPNHVVTLLELDRYVADRVEILSSEITAPKYRRQAAKTYCTGNISLEQIPIAVYGP